MKKILVLLLFACFLVSCNEQGSKEESQINSLFASGDTVTMAARIIDGQQSMQLYNEKGDTVIISTRQEAKTVNYNTTVIDTVVKRKGSTTNPPTTPPVTPPDPPSGNYGTLIFQSGFDNKGDINTNQGPQNSISTTVYKTGPGSFKSQAGTNASNVSAGYRGEMQFTQAQTPAEGVYEYDVYYENWKRFAGGGHSVQWHPNSSSGSAVISLQNYNGSFNVVRSLGGTNYHQSGTLMPVQSNRWYRMRWEIKFSTGNDGYIRLFIDDKLYYTFTGRTSSGGQYFKLGQNRWNTGGENSVVYYDNLKIYKK